VPHPQEAELTALPGLRLPAGAAGLRLAQQVLPAFFHY